MFTEALWREWVKHESANYTSSPNKETGKPLKKYLKKGYTHFDPKFWFPERQNEIKEIVKESESVAKRSFFPFLKIEIKTPRYRYNEEKETYSFDTKVRPICFAAHKDALIFGFYSFCLTKKYEEYIKAKAFDESVIAYRSDLKKSNIQFAKEAFEEVKRRGQCTAIALDVKGYFDNIDHILLKEKWAKVLGCQLPNDQYKLYKTLTRYGYVNKKTFVNRFSKENKRNPSTANSLLDHITDAQKDADKFKIISGWKIISVNNKTNPNNGRHIGIPQGSAISALLSNIYLIDFDEYFYRRSREENFYYRRYCDDILLICDGDKADYLIKSALEEITKHYLTIQPKKVEVIDFTENSKGEIRAFDRNRLIEQDTLSVKRSEQKLYKPLQYLGFEYDGKNVRIRSSSLSRYFRKMKARIKLTVAMAYGKTGKTDKLFKQKLYHKYTHLGKRNFLKYAYNASRESYENIEGEIKEGLNSPAIRKQLARHFNILKTVLEDKNAIRYRFIQKKRAATSLKKV